MTSSTEPAEAPFTDDELRAASARIALRDSLAAYERSLRAWGDAVVQTMAAFTAERKAAAERAAAREKRIAPAEEHLRNGGSGE